MADSQSVQAAQPTDKPMSVSGRFFGVIVSPQATFQNIARFPNWVVPLIVVAIAGMLSGYFLQDTIVQMAREQIAQNPNLTPEQVEQAVSRMEGFTRLSAWLMPLITTPIMFLIIAGILMLTGNVFLGAEATFRQVFSVVSWSAVITVLSSIINVPFMRSSGELNSLTNLTFLAPNADMKSATFFLLQQLDLFYIWWVVLMGMGMAAVYNFTVKKGITIVVSWWLVYILVSLGLKSLF
ncbi:MAG: Yip1 family protein [candidate division KSB1 bacterium]|nr:Yip1 family protein [candidate division KSB1 bacterium]MDQ7064536.1 Yip1 family protein [candidate division KSB1 bacterium]